MNGIPPGLSAALSRGYRIERELGQGGMAAVYLAEDLKHHRKVAIKVLKPELAAALAAERFLREIRIAANLSHPHIVPLHDSGDADGFLYYVMPYIEGESLGTRLRRDGGLPLDESVRILREVADALAFAHERGIVHRDIKPENVMLTGGHALVSDFGVAKAIAEGNRPEGSENPRDLSGITTAGMAVGTPAYMAPEQVAADPRTDHRADIYAFGILAYELLSGRTPFAGLTPQAMLAAQVMKTPDSVLQHREDCPAALESLVMRCLAKEPGERWQTAGEIRFECDRMTRTSGDHDPVRVTPKTELGVVVLPFVNQSPDAANEYFSDGLTEELIADLAKVRALRVISRTSSMQLKGTTKGIRAIARELGVRYVLEGSVRRAGNSLRITTQLIDATSDAQLWSEKYSGTADDVFDLQERVSRAIVTALDVTLSPQEERSLANRTIGNIRAFEFYLQARQALQRYQLDRGVALLEQAIAIEGEVPALRALRAYSWYALVRMGESREQPLARVEVEARALIEDAPDLPYGYALRGFACYERGDLKEAVKSFTAALARDPNDADVLFQMGISFHAANRIPEATATSARLVASDPLSAFAELLGGANTWFEGHVADGVAFIARGVAIEPESVVSHWALGYNYALAGRFADAAAQGQWMQQRAPQLPYTVQLRALVSAAQGRRDEALEWLRQVDETRLDAHHTFHLSESFAMAGDTGHALELVERAVDNGFYPYDFLAVHCPFMAPLRGSPEFERILAKAARRVAEFAA